MTYYSPKAHKPSPDKVLEVSDKASQQQVRDAYKKYVLPSATRHTLLLTLL
jgi:hypothetical protein